MNKSTSLYLDFLRVIAAFGVLFVHASLPWFSNHTFIPLNLGHRLVMVFFVLSGYLIAYTVDKKNKGSVERAIKYLSSIIFSLYLYHLSMLVFIAAVIGYYKSITSK